MIIQEIANTNPQGVFNGSATMLDDNTPILLTLEPTQIDFCQCKCQYDYKENVFAKVGQEDWKNDKRSFLFKKAIALDTIVIKLYKNGIELATITDDTYGTYYSTFTEQPLYVGFVLDFEKVYPLSGAGEYQIKAVKTIMGVITEYESQKFILKEYSDLAANNTVLIETYNTGTILSSAFDYKDLIDGGWYQAFRVKGILLPKKPKLETDTLLDQDYNKIQVQDKIINEWELETYPIPSEISNIIIYDNLLANRIIISDYNLYNEEVIKEKELFLNDISEKTTYLKLGRSKFLIKFVDKQENIVKNNF